MSERAQQAFHTRFGRAPSTLASANGRVNLIGEHTDYNGGFVLPTPIPQRTWVALARRADDEVHVDTQWPAAGPERGPRSVGAGSGGPRSVAAGIERSERGLQPGSPDPRIRGSADPPISRSPDPLITRYSVGSEARTGEWIDYVRGVTWTLAHAGFRVGGFDALISSDVPVGCGVSSSAALEVAMLRALREVFALDLDDVRMAQLAQRGENEFVGAPVGIMDPMCCCLAEPGSALLLDTRSLEFTQVALPANADLVVINSGVSHRLAEGDHGYATRRQQCEEAARRLGVALLREVDERDMARVDALPDVLRRRVRHVITENSRVHAAAAALQTGDLETLGRLFAASHASMRDDYEVSVPEVDLLVDIASSDADIYGARLTGGGFGGAVVMLAMGGSGAAAAERIAARYEALAHQMPAILVPQPSSSATETS